MRNQNQNSTASNAQLDTAQFSEEDMVAFNQWLDQREAELIAEEGYWEEQNYRRQEMEAWKKYSAQHPLEKYDTPDFYFERD